MIYVYKLWDFYNGYWTTDSSKTREEIDESDSLYYMTEQDYNERVEALKSR